MELGFISVAKIRVEPVIGLRDRRALAVNSSAVWAIDESDRIIAQLLFQGVRIVGCANQVGTSNRRAVQRIMQARILPNRTEDSALDAAEADLLAFDHDKFLVPRPIWRSLGKMLVSRMEAVG